MTNLETGSIVFEMAKVDGSIAKFFLIQNILGNNVVDNLGDDEQRKRILSETINMKKMICFGMTEPDYGSDASGLKTTATKVDGGYLLTGEKRWIGNASQADYVIVWARNVSDGNKVQGFVVPAPAKGMTITK